MNNFGGLNPQSHTLPPYGYATTPPGGGNVPRANHQQVVAAPQMPPPSSELLTVQAEIDALRPAEHAIRARLRFAPSSTMSSQEITTISRVNALRNRRAALTQPAPRQVTFEQSRQPSRSVYQAQYLQQRTHHRSLGVGSAFMFLQGTLQVLSASPGNGGAVYHAVYTPAAATHIASSNYSDLRPMQDALVSEHLENYREDIQDAESALGVAPIRVSLTPDGAFAITDGHHRLAAAVSLNRAINVRIDPGTEPGQARANWSQVRIIPSEG